MKTKKNNLQLHFLENDLFSNPSNIFPKELSTINHYFFLLLHFPLKEKQWKKTPPLFSFFFSKKIQTSFTHARQHAIPPIPLRADRCTMRGSYHCSSFYYFSSFPFFPPPDRLFFKSSQMNRKVIAPSIKMQCSVPIPIRITFHFHYVFSLFFFSNFVQSAQCVPVVRRCCAVHWERHVMPFLQFLEWGLSFFFYLFFFLLSSHLLFFFLDNVWLFDVWWVWWIWWICSHESKLTFLFLFLSFLQANCASNNCTWCPQLGICEEKGESLQQIPFILFKLFGFNK